MKKLAILSAIALSGLIYNTADAQIRIHLGLHFSPRPVVYVPAQAVVEQAPVYDENQPAYDDSNDDDYYYLPDVDAYYDVNAQCYYYNNGDNWISAAYLPGEYRNYDWRNARRYEVHGNRPYMHNDVYRSRYSGHEITAWRNINRDNHFNHDTYYRNDNRFNNHDRFNRPEFNRNNDQHFGDGDRGRFNQPNQNRGHDKDRGNFSQPSNQNNGHNRDNNRGDTEHFAQNNNQGSSGHRMGRF